MESDKTLCRHHETCSIFDYVKLSIGYSLELNPTEAIGNVIKDRIGNVLWETIPDLE